MADAVEIGELLADDGLSYGIVQPGHHDPIGVPIIRVSDLESTGIDRSSPLRVSHDIEEKYSRTRLRGGEVLVSIVGTVGRVAVVPTLLAGWNVARAIAVLRPSNLADSRWIRYCLESPPVQRQMQLRKTDTVQATLNLRDLRRIEIPYPETLERVRIAGVLGALDDLIDTNRRIADDSTTLCRVIMRNAISDATNSAPLSELAYFMNGRNFTKGASGYGRPVIRTPEVRRGPEVGTVRSDVDAADPNIAREGDTLFVWSGSLTIGRWMWEEGVINQHVFKVVPKLDVPAWLVFALIEYQMPWFLSVAADKATTMGHIKREHLDGAVPVPSSAEIGRLGSIVGPLWDEALQCGIATQRLTRARDELLPLLLSGQIRVEDMAA